MKIQIIGYSGSGKSTLARTLGDILGVPVLHLDNAHFYGDWQEKNREEMSQEVEAFLEAHTGWVIDGNYSSVAPRRFRESDMTIYLNFGRVRCFFSAYHRYLKYRGRARESCPCREKFDRTFALWILRDGRTPARRKKHLENLSATSGTQVTLKNRGAVRRFVKDFQSKYYVPQTR